NLHSFPTRRSSDLRTDVEHEVPNQLDIPAPWLVNVRYIHVVGGNRDLGQIVEKVIEENLRRQHRQKWQEHHGGGHAEHIAEVGTGAHQQILHDIAECFAPFQDT